MTESEVYSVAVVVLPDESVVMHKSLEAHRKLLGVFIKLVIAGGIVGELELVGTDGGGDRNEGSKSERFHS